MKNEMFFTSSVVDRIREKMIQDEDTEYASEDTVPQKSTEEIRSAFIYASERLSICECC